jgi:hypothetical protein
MAELVVDLLEPVEVAEQDGQPGALAARTRPRMVDPVQEQRPVG